MTKKKTSKKVSTKKETKVAEKPEVVETTKVAATKKVVEKSEDLPKNLRAIKNKNGFFIETIGQGWVKLTKGQLLRLAELINE